MPMPALSSNEASPATPMRGGAGAGTDWSRCGCASMGLAPCRAGPASGTCCTVVPAVGCGETQVAEECVGVAPVAGPERTGKAVTWVRWKAVEASCLNKVRVAGWHSVSHAHLGLSWLACHRRCGCLLGCSLRFIVSLGFPATFPASSFNAVDIHLCAPGTGPLAVALALGGGARLACEVQALALCLDGVSAPLASISRHGKGSLRIHHSPCSSRRCDLGREGRQRRAR